MVSACICGDNRIKRLLTLLYKSNGERRRSDGEERKGEERRNSKKNIKGLVRENICGI